LCEILKRRAEPELPSAEPQEIRKSGVTMEGYLFLRLEHGEGAAKRQRGTGPAGHSRSERRVSRIAWRRAARPPVHQTLTRSTPPVCGRRPSLAGTGPTMGSQAVMVSFEQALPSWRHRRTAYSSVEIGCSTCANFARS
jgi:hypothetical protein